MGPNREISRPSSGDTAAGPEAPEALNSQQVARGVAFTLFSRISVFASQSLYLILLARVLPREVYGVLVLLESVRIFASVFYLGSLFHLALERFLPRYRISGENSRIASLLGAALFIRGTVAVGAIAALPLYPWVLGPLHLSFVETLLFALTLFAASWDSTVPVLFRGFLRFGWAAALEALRPALQFVSAFLFLAVFHWGLSGALLSSLCASAVTGLTLLRFVPHLRGFTRAGARAELKSAWRYSGLQTLSGDFLLPVVSRADRFVVVYFLGLQTVAIYDVAFRFFDLSYGLLLTLTALGSHAADLQERGRGEEVLRLTQTTLRVSLYSAVFLSLFLVQFGEGFLALLLPQYTRSAGLFPYFVPYLLFQAASQIPLSLYYRARERLHVSAKFGLAVYPLQPLLLALLVPSRGTSGAALAYGVTSGILATLMTLYARKRLQYSPQRGIAVRAGALALGLGAGNAAARALSLGLAAPFASLGLFFLLLHWIDPEMEALLRNLFHLPRLRA